MRKASLAELKNKLHRIKDTLPNNKENPIISIEKEIRLIEKTLFLLLKNRTNLVDHQALISYFNTTFSLATEIVPSEEIERINGYLVAPIKGIEQIKHNIQKGDQKETEDLAATELLEILKDLINIRNKQSSIFLDAIEKERTKRRASGEVDSTSIILISTFFQEANMLLDDINSRPIEGKTKKLAERKKEIFSLLEESIFLLYNHPSIPTSYDIAKEKDVIDQWIRHSINKRLDPKAYKNNNVRKRVTKYKSHPGRKTVISTKKKLSLLAKELWNSIDTNARHLSLRRVKTTTHKLPEQEDYSVQTIYPIERMEFTETSSRHKKKEKKNKKIHGIDHTPTDKEDEEKKKDNEVEEEKEIHIIYSHNGEKNRIFFSLSVEEDMSSSFLIKLTKNFYPILLALLVICFMFSAAFRVLGENNLSELLTKNSVSPLTGSLMLIGLLIVSLITAFLMFYSILFFFHGAQVLILKGKTAVLILCVFVSFILFVMTGCALSYGILFTFLLFSSSLLLLVPILSIFLCCSYIMDKKKENKTQETGRRLDEYLAVRILQNTFKSAKNTYFFRKTVQLLFCLLIFILSAISLYLSFPILISFFSEASKRLFLPQTQ
ncbi:hypothetical protein NEFER03_1827 [Nematocida sp. LUAm3]|nr:hypothetical protein NEFER03_1827 [Nematocida sp. LUAm3]KAI5173866.1 hypothetical protein NEFER02_0333 [Nematocida sp. LUAm2]KAI5177389.1 hypothetical protein NEFER01_0664 [Nematocida sp. LUAm1]